VEKDSHQIHQAIFQKHDEFIERLLKQPNGKQKIIELYNIKNLEGYPSLK
jgi:hypothetical protein